MEEYLPEETEKEFREAFTLFDKDGDGNIDIPEFIETLRSLGQNPSQMEIDEMIHEIDTNGDGVIDFEEFKVLMFKKMKDTDSSEDIRDAFILLDPNKTGFVSGTSLFQVIMGFGERMTPIEAKEMVESLDTKEKGKLNYEEFSHLVRVLVTKQ